MSLELCLYKSSLLTIMIYYIWGDILVKKYESKLKSEDMDMLFEAILRLDNVDECYRFFEDICTINELCDMAQRLQVANMLNQRRTYIEITDKTGASTATISRVNRSLNYGNNGYKVVLERIREEKINKKDND